MSTLRALLGSTCLCIALVTACSRGPTEANAMTSDDNRTKNVAAIRTVIDSLVTAIRTKNIDAVMSSYAPTSSRFDIVPPLQFVGAGAFRKPWQDVFARFETIDYEVRDLSITAGDDVAFKPQSQPHPRNDDECQNTICGCARPRASARSMADG